MSPWASGTISNLYYTFGKHLTAYNLLGTKNGYNEQNKIPGFMTFKFPGEKYQLVK